MKSVIIGLVLALVAAGGVIFAASSSTAVPAALFVAENPPAIDGQKPVDKRSETDQRPYPMPVTADEGTASQCPTCQTELVDRTAVCLFKETEDGAVCGQAFDSFDDDLDAAGVDGTMSFEGAKCREHDNADRGTGMLRDGYIPTTVENWCSTCKVSWHTAFRGRCPHCENPVALTEEQCHNGDCTGKTDRGDTKFKGFYGTTPGASGFHTDNDSTVFCAVEGCGHEVVTEEKGKRRVETGHCLNKTTPHRYRLSERSVPCTRCGGTKVCPECMGSGLAKDEKDRRVLRSCWFCSKDSKERLGTGECTLCDEHGFETFGDHR